MNVLIDTHIFIWGVENPPRVPPEIGSILLREDAKIWLSAISVWETRVKNEKGKLPLVNPPAAMAEVWAQNGAALLPLTVRHAAVAIPDPPATRDPFDRLLLAQCEAEGMTLLTVDLKLRTHRLAARW